VAANGGAASRASTHRTETRRHGRDADEPGRHVAVRLFVAEARLLDVLRQGGGVPVQEIIDRVFAAIDAFAGDAPQFDDISMLVVRRRPLPA